MNPADKYREELMYEAATEYETEGYTDLMKLYCEELERVEP
jgi:hypothetical protein